MSDTKQPTVAELVDRIPAADKPNETSTFTGPKWEVVEPICADILAGGRERILQLLDLVLETSDPAYKNYKPEYVLHGLALYVGRPDAEAERRLFAETLAAELENTNRSAGIRGFLVRELQVAGGPKLKA